MIKVNSGVIIIIVLVCMYLLGKYLPETPKETYNHIPSPTVNVKDVVGYDYKKQEYIYTSGSSDNSEPEIFFGLDELEKQKKKPEKEVIYIERSKPMSKKEFEYMVEDYIHDNWDDLRDKFDN